MAKLLSNLRQVLELTIDSMSTYCDVRTANVSTGRMAVTFTNGSARFARREGQASRYENATPKPVAVSCSNIPVTSGGWETSAETLDDERVEKDSARVRSAPQT